MLYARFDGLVWGVGPCIVLYLLVKKSGGGTGWL